VNYLIKCEMAENNVSGLSSSNFLPPNEYLITPNAERSDRYRQTCWFLREYTDKKEKKIFSINRENQSGAVAKSYMRKGLLIYHEMRKFLVIYEEAVSHI
jgi:hypothetical protein